MHISKSSLTPTDPVPPLSPLRRSLAHGFQSVGAGVCGGWTRRMSRPSAAFAADDARYAPARLSSSLSECSFSQCWQRAWPAARNPVNPTPLPGREVGGADRDRNDPRAPQDVVGSIQQPKWNIQVSAGEPGAAYCRGSALAAADPPLPTAVGLPSVVGYGGRLGALRLAGGAGAPRTPQGGRQFDLAAERRMQAFSQDSAEGLIGGADQDRTGDLLSAIQALSQTELQPHERARRIARRGRVRPSQTAG